MPLNSTWRDGISRIIGPNVPILRFRVDFLPAHLEKGFPGPFRESPKKSPYRAQTNPYRARKKTNHTRTNLLNSHHLSTHHKTILMLSNQTFCESWMFWGGCKRGNRNVLGWGDSVNWKWKIKLRCLNSFNCIENSQKSISCFLADIDPMCKIMKNSQAEFLGFSGTRLL